MRYSVIFDFNVVILVIGKSMCQIHINRQDWDFELRKREEHVASVLVSCFSKHCLMKVSGEL